MARRAKGDGALYKRKDGRWAGQYIVETATGAKRKYVYGKTKKEAAQKLREAVAERDAGASFDAESPTVGEYLERWLEDSVQDSVRRQTYESYGRLVRRHIVPVIGRTKLKALTPVHVQRLYREKLDAGLSPRTVQYVHAVLRRALRQALRWRLVPENVCDAVDPPRPARSEVTPLTAEQVKRFLAAAKEDRLRGLYVLAMTTGLRQGELFGLRWTDIDLQRGVLSVNRSLTRTKEGPAFDRPKTAKSRRSVGLTPGAVAALREHRQRQRTAGLYGDSGLVFSTTTGTPLNPSNLRAKSFKPLLMRAGLPDITFHAATRHTYATMLLTQGTHPKIVQESLGHAQIGLTLDTYSHLLPGMGNGAADAIRDALEDEEEPEEGA